MITTVSFCRTLDNIKIFFTFFVCPHKDNEIIHQHFPILMNRRYQQRWKISNHIALTGMSKSRLHTFAQLGSIDIKNYVLQIHTLWPCRPRVIFVLKSTEHAKTDCVKVVETKCIEMFVHLIMPSYPTLTTVLTGFHTNMTDRKTWFLHSPKVF